MGSDAIEFEPVCDDCKYDIWFNEKFYNLEKEFDIISYRFHEDEIK